VQVIPHVTAEFRTASTVLAEHPRRMSSSPEIGGTTGDIELPFLEASRVATGRRHGNVVFVHVTFVPSSKRQGN